MEFDLSRIFAACSSLKIFTVEFKDSLMMTPPVGYGGSPPTHAPSLNCLSTLVHVSLGQVVQNSAVSVMLTQCPSLRSLHCNNCPDLRDHDLGVCADRAACAGLECFYVYEAPHLTFTAFQTLLDTFPRLCRFGNLTRWAVNCEGIQQVVRAIRDNNYAVEILCGSHWFASQCAQRVPLTTCGPSSHK